LPQKADVSVLVAVLSTLLNFAASKAAVPTDPQSQYATTVRPLIQQYCLRCHSTKLKKGDLDLERLTSIDQMRKDLKPFERMIEMLEAGEMPPKEKPQPAAGERKQLLDWTHSFLDTEARARAGDPGNVPLRRLSNTEYNCTIRDLTGIDLRPTREFPPDGAAGEGFTNAAESLTDISPTLFNKYLGAAKEVADHAVLLPNGFRFSATKTRRDWTDESTSRLRAFYAEYVRGEGRLEVRPYLEAAVRYREVLIDGKITPREVATKEHLNPNYFTELWRTLNDQSQSYALDAIRAQWRVTKVEEVPALAAEIAEWQSELWKNARVGSYIRPEGSGYVENLSRQVAVDPSAADAVALRVAVKPTSGQSEVLLRLESREMTPGLGGRIVWRRPRFEATGKPPLLLRDYADIGPAYELDYRSMFTHTAAYLAAGAEVAGQQSTSVDAIAIRHGLDAAFLKRWLQVLDLEPAGKVERTPATAEIPLALLDEKAVQVSNRPAINGWRKKGADLPVLVANASDVTEHIPGRVSAHGVAVHPTPREFVAVAWKSPVTAEVRVAIRVAHAHPACGNGVAWWIEHRHDGRAAKFAEGLLDLGQEVNPSDKRLHVEAGDKIVLAVDARDGDHSCDLTEIGLTISNDNNPEQVWDLATDIVSNVLASNPHADKYGSADVWSFVRGPSSPTGGSTPVIPAKSILARWRATIANPANAADADQLATRAQSLLSGPRPSKDKDPDQAMYDKLVTPDSPLFTGVDVAHLAAPRSKDVVFGLPKERFADDASLIADENSTTEIRLPTALFANHAFAVDCSLLDVPADRVVQVLARLGTGDSDKGWDSTLPVLASPQSAGYHQFARGNAEFRRIFPLFLCFPNVVPNDEVVSLKMFHREDEPLMRLFLDEPQRQRLDRLWDEHRFISRQSVAENNYLPLFIGFVTQDQPKSMVDHFESQRPVFQRRADEFMKEEKSAVPKQFDALMDFAARATRRPLPTAERESLLALYRSLRAKNVGHEEAFRGVLARVLVSPGFLFRIEHAPAGTQPAYVDDWELATRLSYFLWSSQPDDQLRDLAAAGQLHDPQVLTAQVERMLKDARLRSLAIEFGTQWIHVRDFDQFAEKNETLFPTFNSDMRKSMYEESILLFQDLFQSDRAVTQLLDADYTFLNETLARHYSIPGVTGLQFRLVEGVRKYSRGGILALGSVQARQAGASRSSPTLRGNWVVETLLGEKLPRPPATVPKLPEEEGTDGLTMRQQVEHHAADPTCAACHVRMDPYGFALESFDAIGRLRSNSPAADTHAKLRDGTEFDGIDGLRNYLLTSKKDVIVHLFCRRLLGYALGRSVTLSDQLLIDEMVLELNKNRGRVSAAVQVIVHSKQFRMIRGADYQD
jgi:hypothetical protein